MSAEELNKMYVAFFQQPNFPFAGQKYQHYSGNVYVITAITMDEKTLHPMISYKDVSDKHIFCFTRRWDEWSAPLEDGSQRFKLTL
jgi:hypothetical protein